MAFETRTVLDGNVVVIEIPEQLNFDVADILRSKLKSLVENKQFRIVIDLTRTKYVDSSGLGAMVSRIAMARSNGGDIRFAAPSELVMDVLKLTHLDKIIKHFKDVESAIESFKES